MRHPFAVLALLGLLGIGQTQQSPPPTAAQQRPVFRGGTHFVRVDAYPVEDGKIVEGLEAAEDFEILEDGKPQKIDSFDFVKFETFTPDAERRESLVAARRLRPGGGSALPRLRHLRGPGVQHLVRGGRAAERSPAHPAAAGRFPAARARSTGSVRLPHVAKHRQGSRAGAEESRHRGPGPGPAPDVGHRSGRGRSARQLPQRAVTERPPSSGPDLHGARRTGPAARVAPAGTQERRLRHELHHAGAAERRLVQCQRRPAAARGHYPGPYHVRRAQSRRHGE